jgi:hypothetical protein
LFLIFSWKSNTFVNFSIRLDLLDYRSQFLTSHAIFNHHAYTKRVDRIIFYKSSSFSIYDVASWGMFPMPNALKPNTCNSCSEANLTKTSFGNDGHYFAIVINLFHSRCALEQAWLTTIWSFYLCMAMTFPKMWTFNLTWSWCQGLFSKVEGLPSLAFFTTKPCTSFKCLVNNYLAQYVIMQVLTLHFHFDPTFVHSLSFWAKLGVQGGVGGL